jgi:ubiquinone/menaquinone biosynthesis C-methylase UbiE
LQGAEETRERNREFFAGWFGPIYRFYMEHERIARLVAMVVWGGDTRPFYASMEEIGRVPDGGVIVDAPCGAGVAFRGLRHDQQVRYIALDLSPAMLERARQHAATRGSSQITFVEGDAESIPLEDDSVDLFLSYWGLHCFPNPEAAIAEADRCLRPGGRLIGGVIVTGPSLRQRLLVRPDHGAFGAVASAGDVRSWLEQRFERVHFHGSGAFAYFSAVKSGST